MSIMNEKDHSLYAGSLHFIVDKHLMMNLYLQRKNFLKINSKKNIEGVAMLLSLMSVRW